MWTQGDAVTDAVVHLTTTGELTIVRIGDHHDVLMGDVHIDPHGDEAERIWIEACWARGCVLVITGDGLRVEPDGAVDLKAGIRLGSVVSGFVVVHNPDT